MKNNFKRISKRKLRKLIRQFQSNLFHSTEFRQTSNQATNDAILTLLFRFNFATTKKSTLILYYDRERIENKFNEISTRV
jgi:hypothetical protein